MHYFLHIPKTAGTSLTNILENNFDYNKILHKVIFPDLFENYHTDLNNFELIRGHFGYWIYKFFEKKPKTITILRKPIEQTLSLYAQQLKAFTNDEYSIIKHKGESLSEILDDPPRRRIFTNHQIRHLTLDIEDKVVELVKQSKWNKKLMKDHKPQLPTNKQADLLEVAKTRLKEFEFVGIAERFEESLLLLYYTFLWYPIIKIPKLNISKDRKKSDDLDEKTLKKLSDLTRFDKKLYNYGLEIFLQKFDQMKQHLEDDYLDSSLTNLKENNQIVQMLKKYYFKKRFDNKIPFTKFIDYNFSQPMIGWNWYEKEKDRHGRILRWLGPETAAEMYFPLDLSEELEIQFEVINSMSNEIRNSLELKINENKIDLDIVDKKRKLIFSDEITFKGIIPKDEGFSRDDYSCLQFTVNNTKTPNSKNPLSKDMRKLALAFSQIKIKPN